MRTIVPAKLEAGRVRRGLMASDASYGVIGAFFIDGPCAAELRILASDASEAESLGWEHVSVSCRNRTPNWIEMSFVKSLFWTEDETVVQFHPPRIVYVNNHPHCLHLWRNTKAEIELPPPILVGHTDVELASMGGMDAAITDYRRKVRS